MVNKSVYEYRQNLIILTDSLYWGNLILEECIQLAYATSNTLNHYYNYAYNQLAIGVEPKIVLEKLIVLYNNFK